METTISVPKDHPDFKKFDHIVKVKTTKSERRIQRMHICIKDNVASKYNGEQLHTATLEESQPDGWYDIKIKNKSYIILLLVNNIDDAPVYCIQDITKGRSIIASDTFDLPDQFERALAFTIRALPDDLCVNPKFFDSIVGTYLINIYEGGIIQLQMENVETLFGAKKT